jgi:endonuclease YncB( thermonuclease family)
MKKLFLILLCLLPFAFVQGQTFEVKVVKVVDGDTFDGMNRDGLVLRFRINAIDTPERGQAYCNVATNQLKSLIAGKTIKVTVKEKDRYGRFIATPYTPSGEDVSLLMLQAGMAWHYAKYDSTEAYANAMQKARAEGKGLWQDANPINPEQYRRSK